MIRMRHIFHTIFPAVLLGGAVQWAYCQIELPKTVLQVEQDTYSSAVQYLRSGDGESAMNLINRDPLIARFALIRMLRDPDSSDLAHIFAALFPLSSNSELEPPLIEFYDKLASADRGAFLNWTESATVSEFVVTYQTQDKFWSE